MGKTLVVLIVQVNVKEKQHLSQYKKKSPRSGGHRDETSQAAGANQEAHQTRACSVIALAAWLTCKRDRAAFVFTSGIASPGKAQGWAMPGVTGCNLRSLCFVI